MVEINLLPWREAMRKKNSAKIRFYYLISIFLVISILLIIRAYLSHQLTVSRQRAEINVSQLIDQNQDEVITPKQLQHFSVINNLLMLFAGSNEKIALSGLTSKGKFIAITGEAESFSVVQFFMHQLLIINSIEFVKLASLKTYFLSRLY
jgi:hypothetical protein